MVFHLGIRTLPRCFILERLVSSSFFIAARYSPRMWHHSNQAMPPGSATCQSYAKKLVDLTIIAKAFPAVMAQVIEVRRIPAAGTIPKGIRHQEPK